MANPKENKLTFYHSPWSRAAGTRWLLEELGVPYDVHFVSVHSRDLIDESYREIQPHKKVPAIAHGPVIVTERAAITIYLADAFPAAGLAPALGDPMRALYLTMLVYSDAVFDPCVTAQVRGLKQTSNDYSFGAYDDMLSHLERHFSKHAFAAGERFSAADTQFASSLHFTSHVLQAVPKLPAFEEYLERVVSRPAFVRAAQLDAALAQERFPAEVLARVEAMGAA